MNQTCKLIRKGKDEIVKHFMLKLSLADFSRETPVTNNTCHLYEQNVS